MGSGSRRQLLRVAESTWGVTPASPEGVIVRSTGGDGIKMARSTLESAEMRSDRSPPGMRMGVRRGSLSVPIELIFAEYERWLELAYFGEWNVAYALTVASVTVAATAKTFTRASGSWLTSGVEVGDQIVTSGFTNAGNNGTFRVTNVTATVITCAAAVGLVNEGPVSDVGVTTTKKILEAGVTEQFDTIEEGFVDIGQYQLLRGAMCNEFALDCKPDSIVTGSFGFVGREVTAYADASIDADPAPAQTGDPFDTFVGSLAEGGVDSGGTITGLSFQVANGLEAKFGLFSGTAAGRIGVGRSRFSGSLTAYFEDAALANKYIAETETSLAVVMEDLLGRQYQFSFPRVKFADHSRSLTENDVVQTLPWNALRDEATGRWASVVSRP